MCAAHKVESSVKRKSVWEADEPCIISTGLISPRGSGTGTSNVNLLKAAALHLSDAVGSGKKLVMSVHILYWAVRITSTANDPPAPSLHSGPQKKNHQKRILHSQEKYHTVKEKPRFYMAYKC